MPKKMEVILTLSNRITLAGALPILVAAALAVLIAAIALPPTRPASAVEDAGTCDLSPVILDMLLARYDASINQCDTLDPTDTAFGVDDDFDEAVWDFSGQGLTEFAISNDDRDLLRILHGTDTTAEATDPIAPEAVRYIDLTGNPLTIGDVDFANIPSQIAVILSADSNVNGFQATEYTITEGSPSYAAVAFPSATVAADSDPSGTLQPAFTISGRDALADFATNAFLQGAHTRLIDFGTEGAVAAVARTAQVNSVSDNRIFYLPLHVNKDNDNRDEWDFTITITDPVPGADTTATFEITNDEADITVLDADAPSLSVCDRSEDVEAAILGLAGADGLSPANLYGGHTKCDDLTLRDLGQIPGLAVLDSDEDNEPIADLVAGDFEGLTGAATLSIQGARSLPSGIFAGVGKDAADGVQITFSKNINADEDVDEVGNFTPSTIPQHVFDDQEKKQVIILADDLNDEEKGVTSGLDADIYAVEEGSQFFVMTKATETFYVLGATVIIEGDGESMVDGPTITVDRGTAASPKVARYAISPEDDNDGDDESIWLFLFNSATPTSAGNLVDLAAVSVVDDD